MEIYFSFENGLLVVKLVGELDEHSAEFVRRRLDTAFRENTYSGVILDLSRMSFMDSTGIGVVIGRYKLLKKNGKQLFVRSPSPTVDKIFRMAGLYEIIDRIG